MLENGNISWNFSFDLVMSNQLLLATAAAISNFFFYLFNGLSSMNISSMYVKRGLAHLFSNTSKSTKKIDTLDKKIQAATPCSRYCSSRWSFLFLLSSFVVNVAAPHSEKAFCSKLNPDVCDSTLWALLMSFIWATAICPCHYFCCFRFTRIQNSL